MKTMMISIAAIGLFAFAYNDILTGRWESKPSKNGNVTGVLFKSDNSFEGYVNAKPFVTGKYTLLDSIFTFVDNGCDGKSGIYKTMFFSNGDSLRFEPISDSCTERKEGMSRLVLGRKK